MKTRFFCREILTCIFTFFICQDAMPQMRQVFLDTDPDNEIVNISFSTPSQGYVAFDKWIGYSTDSGRTFTKKYITSGNVNYNGYSVNLTFGFQILGIKAFNQTTLIAYGSYGLVPAILYSTDGGNSFTLVYHSQFNQFQLSTGITDMVFPENNITGYAIDADRILKTTNGGQNWTVIRTDPGSFFDRLDAVNNSTVLVMSTAYATNKLLKTDNAGLNWTQLTLPNLNIGKFYYATFLTTNIGWLSMYDNDNRYYFYKTTNGGAGWTLQNDIVATSFRCDKMHFIDENTGYALYGQNTIYKTLNSGILWQPLPRDNNYSYLGYTHNDLQCLNVSTLWAGGGHGFLELSTNGGGNPLPKSYFRIDTAGVNITNNVNLVNYSNPAFQFKWYVNNALVSTAYNASYTHNLASQLDSVRLITTSGGISDTLVRFQYFMAANLPLISSFSPVSGSSGSLITIHGTSLTNVLSVKFGGVPASSFNILSDTIIQAIVGAGASGDISITNVHGTVALPAFTYFAQSTDLKPVISSIMPMSGIPGTNVTITGSNFGTSTTNNIVFFGAVKASIVAASSTQLQCLVPAGASYESLILLNKTTGLMTTSFQPFSVTFPDSSNFTSNSFSELLELPVTQNNPHYLISKDIDGDGKPDLLSSYWNTNSTILRNTSVLGSISFAPGVNIDVKGADYKVDDIDGDGKPDIVGSALPVNIQQSSINVLRNTSAPGSISFAPSLNLYQNIGAGYTAIADIDNDGKNDLLSSYNGTGSVTTFQVAVARNTSVPGNISFARATDYATANSIIGIAAGDLDGDGKKDMVAYTFTSSNLTASGFSCFRNLSTIGNIAFALRTDFVVPGYPSEGGTIGLFDYDLDGKTDVIVINGNYAVLFRNISTGVNINFAPPVALPVSGIGMGGSVSNISGGRCPDLISGNWFNANFLLFKNMSLPGNINNNSPVYIGGTSDPNYTSAADYDLDGKMDLAISSWDENKISIYKNNIGVAVIKQACAASGTVIQADVTGTIYLWQQQIGNGNFVNLINGPNLSGAETASLTLINIPFSWNNYKFRCLVDGNIFSSTFLLKVRPEITASIVINASATAICNSYSVNFTSIAVATDILYTSYAWQVNEQNVFEWTDTYFANSLRNNDRVRCILTAYDSCGNPHYDTSNVIVMTVYGSPGSVVISTPSASFCTANPVTFTATSMYPDITYSWVVNGLPVAGATSNSFTTSALLNNQNVYCVQVVPPGCNAVSNTITMQLVASCPCITNTWTGTVNNAWENPANWSCGTIPGPSSVVVINSGIIVVSSNPSVYSLTVGSAVNLTVAAGFNLVILH